MRFLLAFLTIAILLSSCKKEDNIIESFDALSNYPQTDTVKVDMLLENAVFQGIVLPAKEQYFVFDAKIHNPKNKQLYYKIYYQNESYKFHEDRIEASENFYGSWQETQIGFKPFSGEQIIDSFQIVGNPRNEVKYFGKKTPRQLTKEDIEEGTFEAAEPEPEPEQEPMNENQENEEEENNEQNEN